MVIYEVNLLIEEEVYNQFQSWLKEHAREMLQFPGFIHAHILKPENEDIHTQKKLTVQYQVDNKSSLTNYFNQYAAKMREEGLKHFKDKFSAVRRIYEVQEYISK
ncbi:DUF4286 family protein [Legionella maioricensis]|uniref:DUF4286 family protein n=1 Tax=Legionella maioricensis TaxID=2896528 RepID=A0A9X2IED3_9GAMM|nr:DUF4286 family protein [Legionella maioricensis]MCL9685718.1 DUF4286 family protein [Legionella maioricensis]MCL9688995.1 DUF4286 family protein [Legionella maioricensis]